MGAKRKLDGRIENPKKFKRISEKKQKLVKNSYNRMDEAFLRFPHLPEQIFAKLDNKSLINSRVVSDSWHNFIDEREYPWKRFKDVVADLNEKCVYGETPFHLACENGQAGIAEMIMKNSVQYNVNKY